VIKSTIQESELVSRLKSGDRSALAYLYDHYTAALNGVVSRIIVNQNIAEEVLQDVFLKIWDRIDQYDASKGRLFTWMLNLARNQAIDKSRSREIANSNKTNPIENIVSKAESQEASDQKIDAIGLTDVLNQLSEEHKFVVTYLYLKGYTQRELAKEFEIPLGTVKTRLRMAMIELRAQLKVN
jgi:RNA polymerase sigma-70 factor (ECF subfamily)